MQLRVWVLGRVTFQPLERSISLRYSISIDESIRIHSCAKLGALDTTTTVHAGPLHSACTFSMLTLPSIASQTHIWHPTVGKWVAETTAAASTSHVMAWTDGSWQTQWSVHNKGENDPAPPITYACHLSVRNANVRQVSGICRLFPSSSPGTVATGQTCR